MLQNAPNMGAEIEKMLIKIRVQKNIEISIQKEVPPLSPRVSLSRLLLVESPPKKHNQREKTTKRGAQGGEPPITKANTPGGLRPGADF